MGDTYKVVGRLIAAPAIPGTLMLITAGSTKRLRLKELIIGSTNAGAVAGAEVSVGRPTSSGTGGAAFTPLPEDGAPAAIFTALTGTTVWSAEPTQPTQWDLRTGIDALTSLIWRPDTPVIVPVSARLAVRIEADNSATKVQWAATMIVEE